MYCSCSFCIACCRISGGNAFGDSLTAPALGRKASRCIIACAKSVCLFVGPGGWLGVGVGLVKGVWGLAPLSCSNACPGPRLFCSMLEIIAVVILGVNLSSCTSKANVQCKQWFYQVSNMYTKDKADRALMQAAFPRHKDWPWTATMSKQAGGLV